MTILNFSKISKWKIISKISQYYCFLIFKINSNFYQKGGKKASLKDDEAEEMSEQEIGLGEDVSTMMTWGQYAPFFHQHVLFQFDFCSNFKKN